MAVSVAYSRAGNLRSDALGTLDSERSIVVVLRYGHDEMENGNGYEI